MRPKPRTHTAEALRKKWKHAIVHVIANETLKKAPPPQPRPDIKFSKAYLARLLPKDAHSEDLLLSTKCSDMEFANHFGPSVTAYMHFTKRTCRMFMVATLLALPQFAFNFAGHGLGLSSPFGSKECDQAYDDASGWLMKTVTRLLATLAYLLYGIMLGNSSFGSSEDTGPTAAEVWSARMHLISQIALACYFCWFAYTTWTEGQAFLRKQDSQEERQVRASDFTAAVRGLPAWGVEHRLIRSIFRQFGEIAAVVVSRDQNRLVGTLKERLALEAELRDLHVEYSRCHELSCRERSGFGQVIGKVEEAAARTQMQRLRRRMLPVITRLQECRHLVRTLSKEAAPCTGHAFVVFKRAHSAAACVRHYERIRRNAVGSGAVVDQRWQTYRGTKLEVHRAREPSDIIWENLATSRATAYSRRVRTSLLMLLLICLSTAGIVYVTYDVTFFSTGILTTLWSTPLIIVSNVTIFALTPNLSIRYDGHRYRSSQHLHMLLKMAFFQSFNTLISASAFFYTLWPAPKEGVHACPVPQYPPLPEGVTCLYERSFWDLGKPRPACILHWYTSGAVALLNSLVGDLLVILLVVEFLFHGGPDKFIKRHILARRARTQDLMNRMYALDSEFYIPFRYQLTLKMVIMTFFFCPALPLLLPFAAIFMFISYKVDRYNLMRVFPPPPRTTEKTVAYSALYILPAAVFGHVFYAAFFYSKQSGVDVPSIYFLAFFAFGALVLVRISLGLAQYEQEPLIESLKEADPGTLESERAWMRENTSTDLLNTENGGEAELRNHIDQLDEMYHPPLVTTILTSLLDNTKVNMEVEAARESARQSSRLSEAFVGQNVFSTSPLTLPAVRVATSSTIGIPPVKAPNPFD